jgi:hypothetical protein
MEEDQEVSALATLLASSAAEGHLDSEGGFTVNFEAARAKLSKFQLSNSSFYLLKFLQSAVWGGGSAVDLQIDRRESFFRVKGWMPDGQTIASRLCQPELGSGADPINSLVVGLRALLAQKAVIALQFPELTSDNILILSEKLEWRTTDLPIESFSVTVSFPQGQSRSRAEDLKVLSQRCYCYPLELTVNGKPFDQRDPYWPVETELGHHLPGSTVLASAAKHGKTRHVFVRASLEQQARISLIRGGVVSDVVQQDLKVPGLDILVEADQLETDLTGLQIRQDAKFHQLLGTFEFEPNQLKKEARQHILGLRLSSVPPQMGYVNNGLGIIGGVGLLYLILKLQWFLILRFGGGAALLSVLAIPLFYFLIIKLDTLGLSISHAPDGLKKRLIEAMLEKLN